MKKTAIIGLGGYGINVLNHFKKQGELEADFIVLPKFKTEEVQNIIQKHTETMPEYQEV